MFFATALAFAAFISNVNADTHFNGLCWDEATSNPATAYRPFYDTSASVDCSEEGVDPATSQCGVQTYGANKDLTLNWVQGTDHGVPTWIALDAIGKSTFAPGGLMFAVFKLDSQGGLRDAHWHSNTAEISYIISGKGRVTVSGLPTTDVTLQKKKSNLRGVTVEGAERNSDTFLLNPGDAFYSPVGYHHYFEGVDPDEPLYGLAVFSSSDIKSFDTPQMLKGLPSEIMERTLGLDRETIEGFYKGPRRVISDPTPTWSQERLMDGVVESSPFKLEAMDKNLTQAPREEYNGVSMTKVTNKETHPQLEGSFFSFAFTEIAPGAAVEPYWMDDAEEIIFVVEGSDIDVVRSGNGVASSAAMKEYVQATDKVGCLDKFTIGANYMALNEIGSTWTLTNNGNETAKILRTFNSENPSLSTLYDAWVATPVDVKDSMMHEY